MISCPVFVLSVKDFRSRQEHIRELARRFKFAFEFIFEYDIDDLTQTDIARFSDTLPKKNISCVLKHMRAQELLLESGEDCCIVLEDDVVLFEKFVESVALVQKDMSLKQSGWLVFLGGADNKLDQNALSQTSQTVVEGVMTTAEAYMFDRESASKRLQWLEGNIISLPADHLFKFIDGELDLKQYRLSFPMATQGSITGLFPTSLDHSRSKHSPLFLASKYHYNRFRRQIAPRIWRRVIGLLAR